jgi:eukaryotic-like serine/threonine-protein kinase
VRPYSPGKPAVGKWQISLQPGADARWRSDGKELYYLGTDGKMMAVDIRISGGHFEAGVPRLLFETRTPGMQVFSSYGVDPDGRFLIRTPAEQANIVPIVVMVNWMAELKK